MADLSSSRVQPAVAVIAGVVEPLPPAARFVVRGAEQMRSAAGQALGVELPQTPCRSQSRGARAALWLGPDEWLLLAPVNEAAALEMALGRALAELPHSLVEVSHRQMALSVGGAQAALLLASGCPLDLDVRAFPVEMCTRTMLAKAEIVLWRTGPAAFRIEVWRSFAAYVSQYLAEAARGL